MRLVAFDDNQIHFIYALSLQLYEYKDFEEDAAHDFCKLIDRLLFVIYLIIFCTCTAVGY